jgi:hypothetical protein
VAHFVFAFHVFFVLLILRLLSWIVSNCIETFGLELGVDNHRRTRLARG